MIHTIPSKRRFFPLYFLAFCLVFTSFITSTAEAARFPTSGELYFDVMRNGKKIGTHEMNFNQNGEEISVDIKTDINVKIMFVSVYHFYHQAHETWRNGELTAMNTTTDDDGDDHHLTISENAEGLAVNGDAWQGTVSPAIIPGSLWAMELTSQTNLVNTLDGSQMSISVADKGNEIISAHGHQIPAHHYSITGDLNREIWYDQEGILARFDFKGDDGSDISYILQ